MVLVSLAISGCAERSAREEPARQASNDREEEPAATSDTAEPAVAQATSASPPDCTSGSAWRRCVGKRVRVVGRRAPDIMQHPIPPPGLVEEVIDYVDVEGTQIVVVSRSPMECAGEVEITGILREVNLNGREGTKDEYRGYRVEDASSRCL